jgi:hypothetical protein
VAFLLGILLQAAPALATAPPNDNFASAQQLSGTSVSVAGTTFGATLEPPNEPPHYVTGNGSVWYSWTAPETSVVRLDNCDSAQATNIQIYRGSTLGSLAPTEVTRRSDDPRRCNGTTGHDVFRFNVVAGATYQISVIEYVGDTAFTLTLSSTPTPNDDFATPQDLGQQPNVDVDGTTVGATVQPGEDDYFATVGDGDSVWYRWTAPRRMRVWIDNCDAASRSGVQVYTGTALGSLSGVRVHYGEPPTPSCEGDGLFGARDEFLATAGTTYMIRVYSDLYDEGAFHLRMREIVYDGSLTQSASATKIKKGKTVTYTVVLSNLGTIPIAPAIDLVTSQPNKLGKPVVGSKYLSIETTAGKCERVKFFAVHPGVICEPGDVAPGDSVRIVAKVRPSQSLSHWAGTDYAHGGDSPIYDDDPDNDPFADLKTIVKPKKHHHH